MIYWVFYSVGQALHILMRGQAASLNAKRPLLDFFKANWIPIVSRIFLCTLGFITWREGYHLAAFLKYFGMANVPPVPLTYGTAGLFGYFSDSALAWVFELVGNKFPMLKSDLTALGELDTAKQATPAPPR